MSNISRLRAILLEGTGLTPQHALDLAVLLDRAGCRVWPEPDLPPSVMDADGTVDPIECCASGSCEVCRR